MNHVAKVSEKIAKVLPEIGHPAFYRSLTTCFESFLQFNEVGIFVYEPENLPVMVFGDPKPESQPHLDAFLTGAFLLDPYYVAATKNHKNGFFRLGELAPTAFKKSEYYRIYYQHSQLQDECGYLIQTGGGGFVNIELGRTNATFFSNESLQLLRDIAPLISTITNVHIDKTKSESVQNPRLRTQLESALSQFGTSVLTSRETQVVNLILSGHSTRTIAEKLAISPETVKLHRKHAYTKFDINSQSELFYLFIDALKHMNEQVNEDPLVNYFHKTRLSTSNV